MSEQLRCPKCGSAKVERKRNQEVTCLVCGMIFYFVTPNTGSADLDRYHL